MPPGPSHGTPPGGPTYGGYPGGQQPYAGGRPIHPAPGYPAAYGTPPSPYGYGYPGGYGFPGMQQAKTSGLAIAALTTGLGAILFGVAAPVAIGLGIAALVRIRRTHERGVAQAVVGIVAGSLVTLFWVAVLIIAFLVPEETDAAGDTDAPGPAYTEPYVEPSVYISFLQAGECFDVTEHDQKVDRAPCPEPHDGELVAVVTLPAGPYPGERKVDDVTRAACEKAFASYVGISVYKSVLSLQNWWPLRANWAAGDRRGFCTVQSTDDEQLDGSVKGTKR